jgi:hypothetical protein
MRVAAAAFSATSNYNAFVGYGEIVEDLAGVAVGYYGPYRHQNIKVFSVSSVALITLAMRATTCAKFGIEAELQESV